MLSKLNPREVFYYFEEISRIPHGSGNTKELAEYLLEFAKENELSACKDKAGNIIIYANATEGYEDHEPVILQGHMDMVCDKTTDCVLNMEKEGLELQTDGEYVWANGTTLGGDDGIAVAYILAILASKEIPHPPIEALLTADEETDMSGASGLETERLKGKRLINLDSEKEGILTVSCAGGVGALCKLPVTFGESNQRDAFFHISVTGLLGGHSGGEIHKPRQNAVVLLAQMLKSIKTECGFAIAYIRGGAKDNAIPKEAEVIVCVEAEKEEVFEELAITCAESITEALDETEPELCMEIAGILPVAQCMNEESTKRILNFLCEIPNGVAAMSQDIEGLVQTSSNLGVAWTEQNHFCTSFLIRSSVTKEKKELMNKIGTCAEKFGGMTGFDADYPAWEYEAESSLREKLVEIYELMYGEKPEVEAVHAGLECGFFAEKMPGIDMVSFGPNIEDVHTPEEKMDVASVERCWNYLLKLLENL